MNRVSQKVKDARPEYDAVYAAVDARSGGRCEVELEGSRCPVTRGLEHHHTRKPRRSHHRPELVIHICGRHHAQCSTSYAHGKLVVRPRGEGTFECLVLFENPDPLRRHP